MIIYVPAYVLLYAVHSNKVTHTARKNKTMKNFMGTEAFVQPVKHRKLAGIDDTADSIDNSAGKQPDKGGFIK